LTNGASAIVVSMEYRKGPEAKFPAAHDDAFAAYQWVLANASTFGGDVKRIAVVGESAGGNLACNVSIAARDKNVQLPLAQVLVYPIANNDLNAPSVRENTSMMLPLRSSMIPCGAGKSRFYIYDNRIVYKLRCLTFRRCVGFYFLLADDFGKCDGKYRSEIFLHRLTDSPNQNFKPRGIRFRV